jgi:hypothetical protein
VQPVLPSMEAASGAQQTEPQSAAATKKDKERERKERQRQRKIEEAIEALDAAMSLMEETAGAKGADAVEEAMQAAAKHASRSEPLAALVVVARTMLEQARAAKAERARVAAEAAAAIAAAKTAAAAAATAKRQQKEEEMAALTLRLQQMQAELGSGSGTPQPDEDETLCVLCLDAPKDHIIAPCGHQCVCEACAEKLKEARSPLCPFCRTPIHSTFKVFVV